MTQVIGERKGKLDLQPPVFLKSSFFSPIPAPSYFATYTCHGE